MTIHKRTHGALGRPSAWELIAEAFALPLMITVLIALAAMFGG